MSQPSPSSPPPSQQTSKAPEETPRKPKHVAWADMVDSMDTMSVEDARALSPRDMGVHFGPIMDEKQFEAYRRARKGQVRIVRG